MSQNPAAAVVKKALTDPSFKAELLKSPNAAVEKALGIKLPSGTTIKVVEDSSAVVHLVLPHAPAKGELPDSELQNVSGGYCYTYPGYCPNNTGVAVYPCGAAM